MPRYAGQGSAINKRKKQISRVTKIPKRKVKFNMAIKKTGLRIPKMGLARPGAVIRVPANTNVNKALKKMKRLNPRTLQKKRRR